MLKRVIKDAKFKYEKNRINKISNDTKKLWKIINKKIGKKTRVDNKIKSIQDNGIKVEGKIEIANIMNNFFCNVGKNLSNNIKAIYIKPKEIERNTKSIFLYPTNADEVTTIIKQLKNKAGGEDKINAVTLKTLVYNLARPLAHILNLSILYGQIHLKLLK